MKKLHSSRKASYLNRSFDAQLRDVQQCQATFKFAAAEVSPEGFYKFFRDLSWRLSLLTRCVA